MTNNFSKLMFGLFCVTTLSLGAETKKEATVYLEVVDDAGRPVPNAEVLLILGGIPRSNNVEFEKKADVDGRLEVKGWPNSRFMSSVTVVSTTPGYYRGEFKVRSNPEPQDYHLKLHIRKKENPIAMYAKNLELELPEQRKDIGFDFQKGDWVKPYGKGEITDCIFYGTKAYEDTHSFKTSVIMSFVGEKTGMLVDPIVGKEVTKHSRFKTSRTALLNGYQQTKEFVIDYKNGFRDGSTKETNYIFRSRVVLDEEGKIESCHYGKMIDAVDVAARSGFPDGNPIVVFTYYFNPTPNDRNLEFEPMLNLIPKEERGLMMIRP